MSSPIAYEWIPLPNNICNMKHMYENGGGGGSPVKLGKTGVETVNGTLQSCSSEFDRFSSVIFELLNSGHS